MKVKNRRRQTFLIVNSVEIDTIENHWPDNPVQRNLKCDDVIWKLLIIVTATERVRERAHNIYLFLVVWFAMHE